MKVDNPIGSAIILNYQFLMQEELILWYLKLHENERRRIVLDLRCHTSDFLEHAQVPKVWTDRIKNMD
jgi:hypothetical protein